MSYTMIVINVFAAILIALVIWWFFGDKLSTVSTKNEPISIVIKDGVYQPSLIHAPANQALTLHFLRKDESACAGTVVFPQLNLAYDLVLNQVTEIVLPPQSAGTLDFTCRMGMYRGKMILS